MLLFKKNMFSMSLKNMWETMNLLFKVYNTEIMKNN